MIQNKKWVQRLKNRCNEKEMGANEQKWVHFKQNGCNAQKLPIFRTFFQRLESLSLRLLLLVFLRRLSILMEDNKARDFGASIRSQAPPQSRPFLISPSLKIFQEQTKNHHNLLICYIAHPLYLRPIRNILH